MNNFSCRSAFCLAIIVLLQPLVLGQSTEFAKFSTLLDQMAKSRNAIKSYQVRMTGTEILDGTESTIGGAVNSIRSFHVEMACDMGMDASLILVQQAPFFPSLAFYGSSPENMSDVFLINGPRTRKLRGKDFFDEHWQGVYIPDPLSLGTGFCFESTKFMRLSQTLVGLRSWGDMQVRIGGPFTTFQSGNTWISFDADRGGIVREIMHHQGDKNRIYSHGEVEPVKVGEHWLPKRVAYTCNGRQFFTWEMEWVSVNEPLPADLFDADELSVLPTNRNSVARALKVPPASDAVKESGPAVKLCDLLYFKSVRQSLNISDEEFDQLQKALAPIRDSAPRWEAFRDTTFEGRMRIAEPLLEKAHLIDDSIWAILSKTLPPDKLQTLMGGHILRRGVEGLLNRHICQALAIEEVQRNKMVSHVNAERTRRRGALAEIARGKADTESIPNLISSDKALMAAATQSLGEIQRQQLEQMLAAGSTIVGDSNRFTFGW